MQPFLPALVVFVAGMVVGAIAWHYLHAKVKQSYAVAQNDINWLKSEIDRLKGTVAPVVAAPPAPPAA